MRVRKRNRLDGRKVARARCAADLTQQELAVKATLSMSYIALLESTRSGFNARDETVAKLSAALGVEGDSLRTRYEK